MKGQTKAFVLTGLAVAILLAVFVSPWASSEPDGLSKVAEEKGFASTAEDHALDDSPVAGYQVEGVDNEGVGKALSGLFGVVLTFVIGAGFFAIVRRRRRTEVGDGT